MSESIGTPHTPGPPVANQPTIFHGNKAEEMLAERDKPVAQPIPAVTFDLSQILQALLRIEVKIAKIAKSFGVSLD